MLIILLIILTLEQNKILITKIIMLPNHLITILLPITQFKAEINLKAILLETPLIGSIFAPKAPKKKQNYITTECLNKMAPKIKNKTILSRKLITRLQENKIPLQLLAETIGLLYKNLLLAL